MDRRIPNRRDFNLVWIAIDALRADHLGAWGYERKTSPNIDRLAAESIRFKRAVTVSPSSNYAYSGTLSGMHGRVATGFYQYHRVEDPTPEDFSLASQLRAARRKTIGVTAFYGSVQDRRSFVVMKNGFDEYNDPPHRDELTAEKCHRPRLGDDRQARLWRAAVLHVHAVH